MTLDFNSDRLFENTQAQHQSILTFGLDQEPLEAHQRPTRKLNPLPGLQERPRLDGDLSPKRVPDRGNLIIGQSDGRAADSNQVHHSRNSQKGKPVFRMEAAKDVARK